MSEFRVNSITNQDGSAGPQVCGVSTFSGKSGVQIPSGSSDFRRQDGGGRGRGVFAGGYNPGGNNTIEFIEIATTGNAVDFGDMQKNSANAAAFGSSTKGIFCGGYFHPSANTDKIQFVTFSGRGNAQDFGNLNPPAINNIGFSNNVRGFSAGNSNSAPTKNVIEMITIATQGHASDFGDMTQAVGNNAGCASPTRGIMAGGQLSPGVYSNVIDFITMATQGNAQQFGELSTVRADIKDSFFEPEKYFAHFLAKNKITSASHNQLFIGPLKSFDYLNVELSK